MRLWSQLLAAVTLCASIPAQQPSSWAALSLPNGANPSAVQELGKLVAYVDSGTLHVFSAFTRQWHSHPFTPTSQLRHANDWVMIHDATRYTAFSSMRGTFETITVSPNAVVVNAPSQRNDSILLVRDGATLHSFSGFSGQWAQKPVSTAASIAVQRHVAVVADGTSLLAMSAYGTAWIPQTTAAPMTQLFADGTVGLAQNSTTIWGFSAQKQTWRSAANPGSGVLPQRDDDVAVWVGPTRLLGFSGLLGEFGSQPVGAAVQVTVDQCLAVATVGNAVAFFSAITAQWTVYGTLSTPTLTTGAVTALLAEMNAVHAYSALTGAVSTLVVSPAQTEINWTAAAVVEFGTNVPYLFSAFTGRWTVAPISPLGALPAMAFNGALLQTSWGFSAFSARTGAIVPLLEAQNATSHVDPQSGILAVEGASALHVFDPRRGTWISEALQGTGPVNVGIWRTTLIVREDRRCIGYGSQTGEIEVYDLPEAEINTRVSSESGSVVTANYLVAYSPLPDLLPLSQFPEFRRVFADGSTLQLQLRGEPAAPAAILVGWPLASGLVLPLGTFFLDPASMGVLWSGSIPFAGTAVVEVPMPAGLHGLRVGFQAGVLPLGGAYVSRMSTLFVP